jgi:tetratricopeptide (TPR) repeat protein
MQRIDDNITHTYTSMIDSLYEIVKTYLYQGRLADAQRIVQAAQPLLDAHEVAREDRLKLLLLYGQVLVVDLLLGRGEPDLLFATARQAKERADELGDQQRVGDALNLLGQAHYFATTTQLLKSGQPVNSSQEEGRFAEAFEYHQQALQLREALNDTRGMSESHFELGSVHERWGQDEQAVEHYRQASQLAEQYGYRYEKVEPARHLALHALMKGNLDQALSYGLRALSLREEAGFKPYLPLDHLLLVNIYLARGETSSAQQHLQQATALAEEMGCSALVASVPDLRKL